MSLMHNKSRDNQIRCLLLVKCCLHNVPFFNNYTLSYFYRKKWIKFIFQPFKLFLIFFLIVTKVSIDFVVSLLPRRQYRTPTYEDTTTSSTTFKLKQVRLKLCDHNDVVLTKIWLFFSFLISHKATCPFKYENIIDGNSTW